MSSDTTTTTATATVIGIGQAIAEKIGTIEGAPSNISFDLVPTYELDHVQALQVVVAPQAYLRGNSGAATRGAPDKIVKVNIAVLKRCLSKDEIPNLLLLTEAIADGIDRECVGNGFVTSVEFDPIYDADAFRRMKVFIAVCTATVKVLS